MATLATDVPATHSSGGTFARWIPLRGFTISSQFLLFQAFPNAIALKRFKQICVELGEQYPPDDNVGAGNKSFDYFAKPSAVGIDADLLRMWGPIMSAHWSRAGLTLKERAFIALTGNVLQGTLIGPFDLYVRLARAAGASRAVYMLQSRDLLSGISTACLGRLDCSEPIM